MNTHRSRKPSLLLAVLLIVAAVLAACQPATGPFASGPTPTIAPLPPEEIPTPLPTEITTPATSMDGLERLTPDAILLEMAYKSNFSRPEAAQPFGRPPVFDLLADGRVIYMDEGGSYEEQRIQIAQLTPQETADLLQKVLDLGFARLQSHPGICSDQPNSHQQKCVIDGTYTILRMRQPDDSLKEIKIYATFANDPQAFQDITKLLREFTSPAAQPYVPQKAALFLSQNLGILPAEIQAWPLDPGILQYPQMYSDLWAVVLQGQALSNYLAATGRNTGFTYFQQDGKIYETHLVPWLPGVDYSEDLLATFPQP